MEKLTVKTDKLNNIENVFLNNLHKHKAPCTVYLQNGIKLQGIVSFSDNISILLHRDGSHSMLVYKHAISTIIPQDFINVG